MRRPIARRSGFTLIELLVVILVIGILSAITFGLFKAANNGRNKSKSRGDIQAISMACQSYRKTYGDFPRCTTANGDIKSNQDLLGQLMGRKTLKFGTTTTLVPTPTGQTAKSFLYFAEVSVNNDTEFVDAWGNPYVYSYRIVADDKAWLSPNFLFVSASANFVPVANEGDILDAKEYWDTSPSGGSTMIRSGIVPATYFDESGSAGPYRADNLVNWSN